MNDHVNPLFRDILNAAAQKPSHNYDDSDPGDCPELNMSNYDHDDVARLNAWAIQAAFCIERLTRELAAATDAGKDGGERGAT